MKYLIMLSILLTSIAIAEPMKQSHYKQHGDTKIFYSAFESSFIAPEVAVATATSGAINELSNAL